MTCSTRLEYFDEAVRDPANQTAAPIDIHQPPAFLHKILQLSAVQLLYDSTSMNQVRASNCPKISFFLYSIFVFRCGFNILFVLLPPPPSQNVGLSVGDLTEALQDCSTV